MECDIAFLAKALNNVSVSKHFTRAADARRRAFEAIFWNGSMGQWLDYWLPLPKSSDMRKVHHILNAKPCHINFGRLQFCRDRC